MISPSFKRRGFTLLETVIAIGVLAVLLTAFLGVFGPATAGIRRAINVQEADRLASTLEQELVNLRGQAESTTYPTGFDKAYQWIEDSMKKSSPNFLFIYQYRGDPSNLRPDGTLEAYLKPTGVAGNEFTVVPMVRRRNDPLFEKDLEALEGRVFAVRMTQLVFTNGQLTLSTDEIIKDPSPGNDPPGTVAPAGAGAAGKYPEAVIAFSAEFFGVSSTAPAFLRTGGKFDPTKLKSPIFTRNLAVRR
jgi:prepilin-type N-terminal cleavage/methylation domain-containing protein